MNRCPITYEDCGERKYSEKGLRLLSRNLADLKDLPYSAEEQIREAAARADKMSIQGIQPKLSAVFSASRQSFEVVDRGGRFILKPQLPQYLQVPENEDLTMKMAAVLGIDVPLHGLVYSKDGSLTYFIRRFDRIGRKAKVAVEDFAQLSGRDRETKYNSSMEQVVQVIERFATFPAIEKAGLFRRILFNFLTGNEDCHLKNFSLIRRDPKIELSPAYDLVNTTIVLRAAEEIALPLKGKKQNLSRNDLIDYFGRERLNLTDKVVETILTDITNSRADWDRLIGASFLDERFKKRYRDLLAARLERLWLNRNPG